jgi:hypothetical protein
MKKGAWQIQNFSEIPDACKSRLARRLQNVQKVDATKLPPDCECALA